MNIKRMHYEVKRKINRLDSQQNRSLKIPEIDIVLNEAAEIFISTIAQPRVPNHLGFETSQRSIDDLRTIVIDSLLLSPRKIDDKTYFVELPDNYNFYVASKVLIEKEGCEERIARSISEQHDDRFEESVFDSSSYEWKEVNIWFYEKGIKIFTDGTFTVKEFYLDYIRKHAYMHNAEEFYPHKSYLSLDKDLLTGSQNCELPDHTHREIIDIAVLLIANDLQLPDQQIKQAKLRLNQFI